MDDVFAGRIDVPRLTARAWQRVGTSFDLQRTALTYERLWGAALARGAGGQPSGTGVGESGRR